MRHSWRVIKLVLSDIREEALWLFLFNLVWCVAAVLIIPLPFATAGLTWLASEIGQGKAITWRTFLEGGRRYWKPAYLWGLANLVGWGLILLNVFFYNSLDTSWATIPTMVFVAVGIWWAAMQMYVFPFLFLQEKASLPMALRNSALLIVLQPGLSVTTFLLAAVITLISGFFVFPLFVMFFSFLALLGNRTVVEGVKAQQQRDETAQDNS